MVRSLLQLVDLPFVSAPAHSPSCSSLHWNICLSHEEEKPAQWERRTHAPVQTSTHKARAHNHAYSHMCEQRTVSACHGSVGCSSVAHGALATEQTLRGLPASVHEASQTVARYHTAAEPLPHPTPTPPHCCEDSSSCGPREAGHNGMRVRPHWR